MHGNVWEWCSDWHGKSRSSSVTDPVGPLDGSAHVIRGGSWTREAAYCGWAGRGGVPPSHRGIDLGFRVICIPSGE